MWQTWVCGFSVILLCRSSRDLSGLDVDRGCIRVLKFIPLQRRRREYSISIGGLINCGHGFLKLLLIYWHSSSIKPVLKSSNISGSCVFFLGTQIKHYQNTASSARCNQSLLQQYIYYSLFRLMRSQGNWLTCHSFHAKAARLNTQSCIASSGHTKKIKLSAGRSQGQSTICECRWQGVEQNDIERRLRLVALMN